MLLIGLTGGIGSGKSTVSRCFRNLGVPVIDNDEISREVVAPGMPALAEIRRAFGDEMLLPDGSLDRARLRDQVFADPAKRRRLEAILHPRIRTRMLEQARALHNPYVVLVIPLLLEAGQTDLVDRVLVVDVEESEQVARTAQRDGLPQAQIEAILAAQASRRDRLAIADDILDNSGTPQQLESAVNRLHERYLDLASHG